MSFEYFTEVRASSAVAEAFRAALFERYTAVEGGGPRHLVLRRRDESPRERWAEDLEISLDPDRIVVVFHSASSTERSAVLRLLEATLGALGYSASFEED